MDDLISREGYKKVIDEQLRFYDPDLSPWHVKILELQRELLDSMPAVDAVPVVHARWSKVRFEKTYAGYTKVSIYYVCSACGKDVEDALFNYCPKCGAKMDGERMDSE